MAAPVAPSDGATTGTTARSPGTKSRSQSSPDLSRGASPIASSSTHDLSPPVRFSLTSRPPYS
jgi:hypothetical protein